jgi:hypothetical protein
MLGDDLVATRRDGRPFISKSANALGCSSGFAPLVMYRGKIMNIRMPFVLLLAGLTPMAVHAAVPANCKVGPYNGVTNGVLINCKLVETAKTTGPAYPGVDASLLGIRTGMSVQQVKAIAARLGFGTPAVTVSSFSGNVAVGNKVLVTASDNYIARLNYQKAPVGNSPSQSLEVMFTSPATGNSSYAIFVQQSFPLDPSKDPLAVKAVMADLLHQFGPASHQDSQHEGSNLCWNFGKQSLIKISPKHPNCYTTQLLSGQSPPLLADFFIAAGVSFNPKNLAKVSAISKSLGDYRLPLMDSDAAIKQLESAGAKYAQMHKGLAGARVWVNY